MIIIKKPNNKNYFLIKSIFIRTSLFFVSAYFVFHFINGNISLTPLDDTRQLVNLKTEILEEKEAEIQKGYFIVGTSKELTDKNIIVRQGGFLGMGRIPAISEDASLDHFTQVNITEDMSFNIGSKKATLVSSHPAHTYDFFGNKSIDSLVVDDPEAFWQHTKVMVILVK